MLNFSFFDYLKFMPSPQLFDLIRFLIPFGMLKKQKTP